MTYSIIINPSTCSTLHFQNRLQGWTELEGTEYPTVEAAEAAIEDAIASIHETGFTWRFGDRPAIHIIKNEEDGNGIVKTIPLY